MVTPVILPDFQRWINTHLITISSQKIEEERISPNSFYDVSVTLIPRRKRFSELQRSSLYEKGQHFCLGKFHSCLFTDCFHRNRFPTSIFHLRAGAGNHWKSSGGIPVPGSCVAQFNHPAQHSILTAPAFSAWWVITVDSSRMSHNCEPFHQNHWLNVQRSGFVCYSFSFIYIYNQKKVLVRSCVLTLDSEKRPIHKSLFI